MRSGILLALGFTACASTSVYEGPLRFRASSDVASCISVAVIEERIESPTESDELRDQVRDLLEERAKKLEATDIVIRQEETERNYAYAKAEAFRCKR